MHPISSTLATMVKRAAAKARHDDQMRGDSHDFERAVYRALTELDRTRPRLVAFAPEEALKRVLARPDVRDSLGAREERQPAPARFALARPWRDAEWHRPERRSDRQLSAMAATRVLLIVAIALGALAATLAAGAGAPAFAGAPHRERHGGDHAQHHEHEASAAGKRKGNTSKTVKKTFSNDGEIAIPGDGSVDGLGPADPYPSTIDIAGFKKARITDVNLTLNDFGHQFPLDVDIMLVAPGGRNAVVLSDVGGNVADAAVTGLTLTLDDEAAEFLPADVPLTSGTFKPLDSNVFDNFPPSAPTPGGSDALSSFDGINPKGQWRLFVVDDGSEDTGNLTGGWTLQITAKSKVKGKAKRKH